MWITQTRAKLSTGMLFISFTTGYNMRMEETPKNKGIETYAGDMAKVIDTSEEGIIKKIIHEQEEQEEEKKNLSPESKKNKIFMIMGFTLIFLALIAIVVITVFGKRIFTMTVAPQFSPIIFTDLMEFKEISGLAKDEVAETINNEVIATKVKIGGVEGIYLTEKKKVIGFREVLTLIKANVVLDQITFMDDNFLLGVVKENSLADPTPRNLFILLKMRSFADIFDGMKAWEQKMFYDLHGFFGVDINTDTNYLQTKDFEDGIVANKNARILRDNDGKVVLMYVFADDTSLIITNSETSTKEIILRLGSSQIRK